MNDNELKQRLRQWASAFGGTQFQRLGFAADGTIVPLDPRPQPIAPDDSSSAEIERIVRCMEETGRWRASRVLRVEYFMASLSETERLQRLQRLGMAVSRTAYYTYLRSAHAFVLGALATQRTN